MELTAEKLTLDNIDKSSWKTYRFDQIAKNISERVEPTQTNLETYVGLDHIDSDSIHIKRFGKREDVSGTKLRCYPGDVIFGRRRAYQRKAAIVTFDGFCSAHSLVLRANPDVILPKLFPFFLHSNTFMHLAVDISVGSLSPTINWGDLKKQEFLLPPKDQQQQIAELLWGGDKMTEKGVTTLVKASATRYIFFESVMKANIDQLTTLGKVITDIVAGKSPMGQSQCANDTEYGVLKVSAVGNEEYVESENKVLVNQEQFDERFEVESGFILVTRANALLSGIGRACIVNKTRSGLMLSDKTLRIIPNPNQISNRFLYQCLLSRPYRNYVESMAGGTDAKNISQDILRKAPIWKPPLKIQNAIEEKLLAFDDSITKLKEFIQTSQALQKSLINQFF